MSASYPASVKSFTSKTDLVDDVMAVDINGIQDEVVAIENDLLAYFRNGWQNYTATIYGAGGTIGTFAQTSAYARYKVIPGICFVVARAQITNVGSWSGNVQIAVPVAASAGGTAPKLGMGWIHANSAAIASPKGIASMPAGLACTFYKTAIAYLQWSDMAANDWVHLNGFYEIA